MTAVVPDIHERGPDVHDVPIGLSASGQRHEFDSLGTVAVPADHYWGAQTQAQPRTLQHRQRPHASLKGVAVTLFKIANDLRWLGSGPRTG